MVDAGKAEVFERLSAQRRCDAPLGLSRVDLSAGDVVQ
jgi:hypothetical protein